MEFSERLKNLRKKVGLTQVDVAGKLGISQQAYALWERGAKKPTQENLVKIAKFYGVTTDYLLEGEKDDINLSNVEVLFRITSDGLTVEEKIIFRDELIEFMKERKKMFENEENDELG